MLERFRNPTRGGTMDILLALVRAYYPYLLAFAVGTFIYIAASDLIPELHKSNVCEGFSRIAFSQLVMLVLGMAVMFSLLLIG